MRATATERDVNDAALTVYGEGRNQSRLGQKAIAWTIRNRAEFSLEYKEKHGRPYKQFGDGSPASACLAPYQYSCWNDGDPNCGLLKSKLWQGDTDRGILTATALSDPAIQEAIDVVEEVFGEDADEDPTRGSTFYHTTSVHPAWARGLKPVITIGAHAFYNNVDHVDNPAFDWSLPTDDPPPPPASTASTTEPPASKSAASSLPVSPSPYASQPSEHVEKAMPFWRWLFASFLSGLRGLFT